MQDHAVAGPAVLHGVLFVNCCYCYCWHYCTCYPCYWDYNQGSSTTKMTASAGNDNSNNQMTGKLKTTMTATRKQPKSKGFVVETIRQS